MKLSELEPRFLKRISPETWNTAAGIDNCDGIIFLCPVCFKANDGRAGTHSIICFKPHVPQDVQPGPGRWDFVGNGAHDLTLVAGSSSIFLPSSACKAHFFIVNGEIIGA